MRLIKRAVDALQPGEYAFCGELAGFGARCQRREKSFVYRYRLNGRRTFVTIGVHGRPWTVDTARAKAKEYAAMVPPASTLPRTSGSRRPTRSRCGRLSMPSCASMPRPSASQARHASTAGCSNGTYCPSSGHGGSTWSTTPMSRACTTPSGTHPTKPTGRLPFCPSCSPGRSGAATGRGSRTRAAGWSAAAKRAASAS